MPTMPPRSVKALSAVVGLAACLGGTNGFGLPLRGGMSKASIAGIAQVIDGDSLLIAGERVRLIGLDAPESDQDCERHGELWSCGADATAALEGLVLGRMVTCDVKGRDPDDRALAVCLVDGTDIGHEMVKQGLAITYGSDAAYYTEEVDAIGAQRGIWAGEFVRPYQWREGEP
jgi:endonuclease YncB( thermonuclease family)